jgi:hypothetical protein
VTAAGKHKPTPRLKTFHATVLVTRLEHWWAEAETQEAARALFNSGEGHCVTPGSCVNVEVERMLDEGGDRHGR